MTKERETTEKGTFKLQIFAYGTLIMDASHLLHESIHRISEFKNLSLLSGKSLVGNREVILVTGKFYYGRKHYFHNRLL